MDQNSHFWQPILPIQPLAYPGGATVPVLAFTGGNFIAGSSGSPNIGGVPSIGGGVTGLYLSESGLQAHQVIVTNATNSQGTSMVVSVDPNHSHRLQHQQQQHLQHHQQQHQLLQQKQAVELYLLNESKEPMKSESCSSRDSDLIRSLEHDYQSLVNRKMQDQLSAFLPDIPGDINATSPDSTLGAIIERPPVGGRDLAPLVGGQLSGFKLTPGQLPESYRMDFSTTEGPQHQNHKHKKKKKHKHKQIKTEPNGSSDHMPLTTPTLPSTPTYLSKPQLGSDSGVEASSSNTTSQPSSVSPFPGKDGGHMAGDPKKIKKKKRKDEKYMEDKKKIKKEKKKKKEKDKPFMSADVPMSFSPSIIPSSHPTRPP